jgi:hypothetical protein
MAGKDESLGYTFHTIVAIIDSLVLRYEDWDGIKVEPNTELDKVDI